MTANSNEAVGLPHNKEELLDWIEAEWCLLQGVISNIPPDRFRKTDSGGWSVKDMLAHIAEWERYLRLHHLQDLPPHDVLGLELNEFKSMDEDGINAVLFERNKDRSLADVINGLHESHERVVRDLREMSFEEITRQKRLEGEEARPLLVWIAANTYEHYREHRAAIEMLTNPQ